MKKTIQMIITAIILLFLCGTASAISFSDTQNQNVWLNWQQTQYTWTFNLDNDILDTGDINAEDDINYAALWFRSYDDRDGGEYTNIALDMQYGVNGWEVDPGVWGWANVTALVSGDHQLNLTFTRLGGDFGISWVRLFGDYTDNPTPGAAPVPEPATMLLVGSGLLGIGWTSRRRVIKNGKPNRRDPL